MRQFMAFTQASEKTAIVCLGAHDWKLDSAVDYYFQNPDKYNKEAKSSTVDKRKIELLFTKYKGMIKSPSLTVHFLI